MVGSPLGPVYPPCIPVSEHLECRIPAKAGHTLDINQNINDTLLFPCNNLDGLLRTLAHIIPGSYK